MPPRLAAVTPSGGIRDRPGAFIPNIPATACLAFRDKLPHPLPPSSARAGRPTGRSAGFNSLNSLPFPSLAVPASALDLLDLLAAPSRGAECAALVGPRGYTARARSEDEDPGESPRLYFILFFPTPPPSPFAHTAREGAAKICRSGAVAALLPA